MTISHISITIVALFVSLHVPLFGMDENGTLIHARYKFPKEMHQKIFDDMNLCSQERMRATSHYWRNMSDKRSSYLLDLLHSPSIQTRQLRSRILFAAIYHSDHDLAEIILRKTPAGVCLYYQDDCLYYPYQAARFVGNNDMIFLLERYNQKYLEFKFSENKTLRSLLLASISGDYNSLGAIINVDLKRPDVCAQLSNNNGSFSRLSTCYIREAFEAIVHNDDHKSIPAVMSFCFNNPEEDWLIAFLAKKACRIKSKMAFEALIQQHKNLNAVMNGKHNYQEVKITLKNEILGINWSSAIEPEDQEYYNEIEAILNKYGAKTYEELEVRLQ